MSTNFRKLIPLLLIGVLTGLTGCGGSSEKGIRLATPAEWRERADGLPNFQEHYGFEWPLGDIVEVELGLAYQAVGTGQAEAGIGDATEGRIAQFKLVVLEDDKLFFPAYNPAPVIRKEILDTYPEIGGILKELSRLLDLEALTLMNLKVAVEGEQPEKVARDFLREQGLIQEAPVRDPGKTTPIVVSGKTFAEALTLGYLTVYLLQDRGYEVKDEVGLGEVALMRSALESGRIDLYWEYTGTGLFNVMNYTEAVTDPEECYRLIRDYDLKNHNLVWLDYAPANNTFVLFISREVQQKYGWTKISELAAHIKSKR